MILFGLTRQSLVIGGMLLSLATAAQQPSATNGDPQPAAVVQTDRGSANEQPADTETPALTTAPRTAQTELPSDTGTESQVQQTAQTGSTIDNQDPTEPDNLPVIAAASPALPHDLSAWGMFMQADWVVKAVMIGLVLASIATWTVLVAKTRELRALVKQQKHTLTIVSDNDSLQSAHQQLQQQNGSLQLTSAAVDELKRSANALADAEGVKERVASSLERLEAANGRQITKGTSILASIGATAPFVGLFGTVWGIMNSFIGISKAQTTNLAVVAPGIAEALLATALGLVAAIPAVVIYNHFARQIAAYKAMIGDTSAAILRLVSRDLSHFAASGGHQPVGE